MSLSNWKKCSGWWSTDDVTGVLQGTPLYVSAGADQTVEDYVTQQIGTLGTAFAINHYRAQFDFGWAYYESISGSFGMIARSADFTTSVQKPFTTENCYIARIDIDNSSAEILRRRNGIDLSLRKIDYIPNFSSETKYEMAMECFGESSTTIRLKLSSQIVVEYVDNSADVLLTGTPGIQISGGLVHVNNFAVMELESNGSDT